MNIKYLIVFTVFVSVSVFSQDPSDTNSEDAESASNELPTSIPATEELESSTNPNSEDFEVFNPSEDISEDLSVPFPADI